VQTFLPYSDFQKSAESLDNRRLGKQRVEVLQLVKAIAYDTGWRNHPATVMWHPYIDCLIHYGMIICKVWQSKGFRDSVWTQLYMLQENDIVYPSWLGDERLHSSHRSNLLRKDPIFYSRFGWIEKPNLPYYWPKYDTSIITNK
jgi:hypothetical protein